MAFNQGLPLLHRVSENQCIIVYNGVILLNTVKYWLLTSFTDLSSPFLLLFNRVYQGLTGLCRVYQGLIRV